VKRASGARYDSISEGCGLGLRASIPGRRRFWHLSRHPVPAPVRLLHGGTQISRRNAVQNLDEIDLKIITHLQDDARTSTARLAKEIGVARTTVISRIARLERDGVIAGYSLRLSREVIDGLVQAFVGITVEAGSGPEVIRKLAKIVEIQTLCSVSGEFDYMLLLQAPSPARLDRLLDEIGSIEGVARTRTSVILSRKIERGAQLF
jgi:DNA-binding Lrp family transcriptional regulator